MLLTLVRFALAESCASNNQRFGDYISTSLRQSSFVLDRFYRKKIYLACGSQLRTLRMITKMVRISLSSFLSTLKVRRCFIPKCLPLSRCLLFIKSFLFLDGTKTGICFRRGNRKYNSKLANHIFFLHKFIYCEGTRLESVSCESLKRNHSISCTHSLITARFQFGPAPAIKLL